MKKLRIYAVFLCMVFLLVGCNSGNKALIQANELVGKGLYEEAIEVMAEVKDEKLLSEFDSNLKDEYGKILTQAVELLSSKNYDKASEIISVVKDEEIIAQYNNSLNSEYINDAKKLITNKSFDDFDKQIDLIADSNEKDELITAKNISLNKLQRNHLYNSIGIIHEVDLEDGFNAYHIVALTKDGSVLISNLDKTRILGNTESREAYKRSNGTQGIRVTQTRALSYVKEWQDVISIASNGQYILGLTKDGIGLTAGTSGDGANAIDPIMGSESVWYNKVRNNNKILSISAGRSHSLAVSGFKVLTSGFERPFTAGIGDYKWEFKEVSAFDWDDIKSVAAGLDHSVGLKVDGTVTACGSNYSGQSNVNNWSNIVAVEAGNNFTIGLRYDGTVVFTGHDKNFNGDKKVLDVGNWKDVKAIASGLKIVVGIKDDGTLLITGDESEKFKEAELWRDIVEVAIGNDGLVGLKTDGTLITLLKGHDEINRWESIGSEYN